MTEQELKDIYDHLRTFETTDRGYPEAPSHVADLLEHIKALDNFETQFVHIRNELRQILPLLTDPAKTSLAARTARRHLQMLLK